MKGTPRTPVTVSTCVSLGELPRTRPSPAPRLGGRSCASSPELVAIALSSQAHIPVQPAWNPEAGPTLRAGNPHPLQQPVIKNRDRGGNFARCSAWKTHGLVFKAARSSPKDIRKRDSLFIISQLCQQGCREERAGDGGGGGYFVRTCCQGNVKPESWPPAQGQKGTREEEPWARSSFPSHGHGSGNVHGMS